MQNSSRLSGNITYGCEYWLPEDTLKEEQIYDNIVGEKGRLVTMIKKDEKHTGNNYSKENIIAPSTKIINGCGDTSNLSETELAIYGFYKAFNEKDMASMTKVWANTEDITAENPAGGIRRGWIDLKWVYDKVLGSPAKVRAEFYDYTIHVAGDVFWSVGRERIFLNLNGEDTTLNVRITRIFRRIDGKWRLVHLHGSFEDPDMMRKYQQATGSGGTVTK